MNVQPMLSTYPRVHVQAKDIFVLSTDACFDCAQACRACADACLGEERLDELRNCIHMNLDCADVCFATGDLAIRRVGQTGLDGRLMELMFETCAEVCRRCGDECMRHAKYLKHCRRCAQVCRCCEQTCRNAALALKVQ